MKIYPPIDPMFYRVDFEAGMTDEEIQQDWIVYCDGLDDFNYRPETQNMNDAIKKILDDVGAMVHKRS